MVSWFWAPTPTSCMRPPGILLLLLDPENVCARNNDRVHCPRVPPRDRFAPHVYVRSIWIRLDWNDCPSGIASSASRRCVGNRSLSDSGDPVYGSVWVLYKDSSNEAEWILSLQRFGLNLRRALVRRRRRHGNEGRRAASKERSLCRLGGRVFALVHLVVIPSRRRRLHGHHQLSLLLGQIARGLEFRKITLRHQLTLLCRQDIACRQRIGSIDRSRRAHGF